MLLNSRLIFALKFSLNEIIFLHKNCFSCGFSLYNEINYENMQNFYVNHITRDNEKINNTDCAVKLNILYTHIFSSSAKNCDTKCKDKKINELREY